MVWARLYTNLVLLASEAELVSATMPFWDDEYNRWSMTKKTAIQIHVIVQGLHRELHGGDAAAQFVVGDHAKPLLTVVGLED